MVRQGPKIFALAAPAYLWLTIAIFLPIAVMFYFSFLSESPLTELLASGSEGSNRHSLQWEEMCSPAWDAAQLVGIAGHNRVLQVPTTPV